MSDQQQWTPVPPPHPYPAASSPRRGLAIAAMSLGLVAILTTVVAAFYFSAFVVLGAILGLVAVVLGIVALATRQVLKGASITGLVAGALSLLLAVSTAGLAVFSLVAPNGPASRSGESAPETQPWAPDDQNDQLIEWPANMATGGIVFGPGVEPLRSSPLEAGETPEPLTVERNGGDAAAPNDVLIYVDYRCPHCAQFEQLNGALLEQALADGSITVEVKPLAFVDRQRSVQASAAMACVADSQPEAAWPAHEALLGPAAHSADAGGEPEDLVALLDDAVGGVDPGVRDCILNERYAPFAQALNDWTLTTPVPNALDPSLTVTGTPTVLVNGVRYEGSPEDAAAFRAFFAEQIR